MSVISSAAANAGGGAASSDATPAHSGRSDDRGIGTFGNTLDLPSLPEINLNKLVALLALVDLLREWS